MDPIYYRAKDICSYTKNGKRVLGLLPISESSWWAGVKDGRYPQPTKLGPRTTVWQAQDIEGLVDSLRKQENL